MTDILRTRIIALQSEHIDRQLTNYDTEREECGCGQQGNATYWEHLADVLIREIPELAGDCYSWCSLDAGATS